MPKVAPIISNMNGGEISPVVHGRVALDQYKKSVQTLLNSIPMVQGGVTRRPGTAYVAEVKTSSLSTRIVAFKFSTTQAYILEFGNLYMRVYKDHAQVTSGGPAYELVTTYATADLFQLKFTQSADVLYVTHPSYAPRKITRTGHAAWTITTIDFLDGPYLPTNTTATTLTPGSFAPGAGVTLTASSTTGINNNTGFQTTDVGRLIRIRQTGVWGYVKITAWVSTTVVTVTIINTLTDITAKTLWRMGVWSGTTGYPSCVTFYEDRLCFGGATSYPQRVDLSKTGDYENFAPTDTTASATVAADNAIAVSLNSDDVQLVRWMKGDEKGLLIGTVEGEWIMRPSSNTEALSPTNVSAKQSTAYGSANVAPVRAGKAVVYTQKSGRKVRELAYVYEVDGFRAPDLSVLAQHIALGGIKEMTFQSEPQSIVWCVRNDGVLLGLTYEREQEVVGWHRHILGGAFGSGDAVVESAAVIPAPDGTRDELWLIVKRTVNGNTVRYIEYLTKLDENGDAAEDAFFVDCGLTYDGAPATTISGLTHLEAQSVAVLADGAVHPSKTVSGGSITLDYAASVVQVGLAYNSDGRTLRLEAGAANGTSIGKSRRIHKLNALLYRAGGLKLGPTFDDLKPVIFRTAADAMTAAVPLYSGIVDTAWSGGNDKDGFICWRWYQPLPGTLLALMPQMTTEDAQ